MTTSSQDQRRSRRIPAAKRLLMTVLSPNGAEVIKEIVAAVELSRHGAHIRGRRRLKPDWHGLLVDLKTGRQAPFRVAWQAKSFSVQGLVDAGVELMADFDFWGLSFPEAIPAVMETAVESPSKAEPLSETSPAGDLLRSMLGSPEFSGPKKRLLVEAVLCGLVEQLEERNVLTRAELTACIKRIGQA